jgi:hypothetical protein
MERVTTLFVVSDAGIKPTAAVCLSTHGQTDRQTDHGRHHTMPRGRGGKSVANHPLNMHILFLGHLVEHVVTRKRMCSFSSCVV